MKIEEQKVPTFNVGRKETAVASIQASAKAFEILSSGLYSDAEFAIVREIAANAWDSHKAAGCPEKPFKVQVPNGLDPRFCVRDYGTSMSHEFMMTRVNRYFDSTKAENNDEIGGFGLGIKSVFSYASSFMISCYMDSVRRVYVYQIGESGLPEISLMAETETDEPNGVEVSIPVKSEDYQKFSIAIQKTFAFYKVKPEIAGVELAIPEFDKLLEADDWFVCRCQSIFNKASYIEMGGIAYPLDEQLTGLRSYYSNHHTLFIKAEIGDVDITPNREQIKMTERTRRFVKDKLKTINDQAESIIQDLIDAQGHTYYWDFIAEVVKYDIDLLRSIGFSKSKITFNGKKFDDNTFTIRIAPKPAPEDPMDPNSPIKQPTLTPEMVEGITRFGEWSLHDSGRVKKDEDRWSYQNAWNFDRFNKPRPIVVADEASVRRIAPWMRYSDTDKIILVKVEPGKITDVMAAIKERLQDFNNIHDASTVHFEKAPRAAAAERKYYMYHTSTWNEVVRKEMDLGSLPNEIYYFQTDGRQRSEVFGRTTDFNKDASFIAVARTWIPNVSFYFLTEAMIKKIEKANPSAVLIETSAKLAEMLDDKVREAGQNYVSRSLEDIKAPFARSGGSWRTASALDFWAKEFNLSDYEQAKKDLETHKPDSSLEKMCKLIKGKTIFEMFTELGVNTRNVTVPSFDNMLAKMPYVFAMVDDYSEEEVVNHIGETMGWKRNTQPVTI
ncbi:MAG: hypothetical protein M0R77_10485 [Gammaproteobacteria bacterium]|nr:hypothetical protein [Gammaproteobacteria bacterium]